MFINDSNSPGSFWQLLVFLIIPFVTIFSIVTINKRMINKYYQMQLARKDNCLTKKITIIISFFGFFLILQNLTYLMPFQWFEIHFNDFLTEILPVASLVAFFQLLLLLTFFSKDQEKIKQWYNIRLFILCCLLMTVMAQVIMTMWQLRAWQFASFSNFLLLSTFYGIFIFVLSRNLSSNFLVLKYLIAATLSIMKQRQEETIAWKYEQIIQQYSKWRLINQLWNFNYQAKIININITHQRALSLKTVKANWILWLVSLRNLFTKNCIKEQSIIINGWKGTLLY